MELMVPRYHHHYPSCIHLAAYLAKTKSLLWFDEFVIRTAERWATADKMTGREVVIMGDFNKSYQSLREWAAVNDISSFSRNLFEARPGGNFERAHHGDCWPQTTSSWTPNL